MIKLKTIIKRSCPAFVNTFKENKHIFKLLAYLKFNKDWLNEFDSIIFSTNGSRIIAETFIEEFKKERYRPKPILLHNDINLGHTFGTIDNDGRIFEYSANCKNIEYIWKFSEDVIADTSILDIDIDETCDFFYINNIGSSSLDSISKKELLHNILQQKYFYPQTNYYIMKNNLSIWHPTRQTLSELKALYDIRNSASPNYPWNLIKGEEAGLAKNEGLSCEAYLAKTVLANDMKKQQLVSEKKLQQLLDLIKQHDLKDGSHKNIIYTDIGNLCHYHYPNAPTIKI